MSPTVRHDPAAIDLDAVHRVGTPRAAAVYACALLGAALAVVVALATTGQSWPAPGPVFLLAIPLALCMNRFVFFPNETGVTADAAVIFAAMLAFQHDALWLGPLVVALLVGPLDARHWGERAFVRMAFNSGSTALVACVGLAAFDLLTRAMGSSWPALIGAAALAAVPYAVSELVLGVALVGLLGERPTAAIRHQFPLHLVALPLAVFGAAAGLAAADAQWWSTFLVLLPAPLVPELLIVVLPRRLARRRSAPIALLGAGTVALALSVGLPGPTARAVAGLAAVACLVLAESLPDRATPFPPLLALVVVAPIAAFPSLGPIRASVPFGVVLLAAVAGTALLGIVASPVSRAAWMVPVVVVAACLGRAWGMAGRLGAVLFCSAMVAAVFMAGVWGPPPWSSRLVGPFAARCGHRNRRTTLVALGTVAVAAAWATVAADGTARTVGALATTALLEVEVAMAVFAVRLWRFAPRRRVADAVALVTAGAVALVVYFPLALDAEIISIVLAAVCALAAGTVAWPLAITVRASSRSRRTAGR